MWENRTPNPWCHGEGKALFSATLSTPSVSLHYGYSFPITGLRGPFETLYRTGMKRLTVQIPLVSTLILLVFFSANLHAQVPDSTRVDTTRAPVFVLRGLTIVVPRPVSTTGGASAVEVTLDSMAMRPAPTMEQVLREMPLIQIRRNSRGEAQPALRGGEDRQIAVLMDGVPLTLGWDARTDLSLIPLTSAQRISIIRGLSSVLHGPNVLGGVVEVDVARGAQRQAAPRPLQFDLGLDQTGARNLAAAGGPSSLRGTEAGSSGQEPATRPGTGLFFREGLRRMKH